MGNPERTVLITGCSDGAGLRVYATARNPSKITELKYMGMETLTLEVLSESSIAACVSALTSIDILINNAGASYSMPVSDLSIAKAKKLFDLDVWSQLAVTHAFLPLLLESKGMFVNQIPVVSTTAVPFQSAYNASKAALAMSSDSQRLELEPFGITIDQKEGTPVSLPQGSIYAPAREAVDGAMRNDKMANVGTPAQEWAAQVTQDLLNKNTPSMIWRGAQAMLGRIGTMVPHGMLDGTMKRMTGLDVVEQEVRK